jgi:ABC-type branched-subunit amino acid transport system substrate-binding protein
LRRRRDATILITAAVLTAGIGIVACGDDEDRDEATAGGEVSLELTIGDIVPLTGDFSDFGPPLQKAADLAIDQIRAAIQEAGVDHQVSIVHEDDETSPQPGVQAARKVAVEGATCIAGAVASAVTIPVAESVTIPEGILEITISTSDEITGLEDDGLVNRITPPDSFQGPALADAIEADLGGAEGRTVNVGARNDAYGTNLADTFSQAWEEKGGEIGARVDYDTDLPSYDSEADELVGGNPDRWVIIDFPETYAKVGPALVRTGEWDPGRTWSVDGLASSSLPDDVGDEATEGMRGTVPGAPEGEEAAREFDRLYKQAGGPGRQAFDVHNFDQVVLCYLSAVAAGSTDGREMAQQVRAVSGPPGTKYTFLQLADAIQALQAGEDIDYQGVSGPIDMNDAGDTTAGVYDVWVFRGGKLETVRQVPVTG